jgi:hypothetical protein
MSGRSGAPLILAAIDGLDTAAAWIIEAAQGIHPNRPRVNNGDFDSSSSSDSEHEGSGDDEGDDDDQDAGYDDDAASDHDDVYFRANRDIRDNGDRTPDDGDAGHAPNGNVGARFVSAQTRGIKPKFIWDENNIKFSGKYTDLERQAAKIAIAHLNAQYQRNGSNPGRSTTLLKVVRAGQLVYNMPSPISEFTNSRSRPRLVQTVWRLTLYH